MEVNAVGVVRSPRADPIDDDWGSIVATIVLDDRFAPDALEGLSEFSHLEVVFAFHLVSPDEVVTGRRHPRGDTRWPSVGIFAQHARIRPNRIGVSVCRLLGVEGRTVTVRGLDAIDGTPVLDLRPYMAEFGPRGRVCQPAWSHELMAGYWHAPGAPRADTERLTRAGYDAVAARYAEQVGDELDRKPIDRALADVVVASRVGGPVLDVGCGPGHVGAYLRTGGSPVVGLDLSPAMAAVARAEHDLAAVAADMTALPIAAGSAGGAVCQYALIHLDAPGRDAAYGELARVLAPGAPLLVAFHTSDADVEAGEAKHHREFLGATVDLVFRFLDPVVEAAKAQAAGFELVARLDRRPDGRIEHPSERTYLLLRKAAGAADG